MFQMRAALNREIMKVLDKWKKMCYNTNSSKQYKINAKDAKDANRKEMTRKGGIIYE